MNSKIISNLQKDFKARSKPYFSIEEINSILEEHDKRYDVTDDTITVGGVKIDTQMRSVTVNGKKTDNIQKRRFDLLRYMMMKPNRIIRREELMDNVWPDVVVSDRTLDVHISSLRSMIGHKYFITSRGTGYGFVEPQ
jgi:DNA-binding response OmpR family regulator